MSAAARTPGGDPPRERRRYGRAPGRSWSTGGWFELPVLLVLAFAVTLLVRVLLVQPFYIPSGSMEATLLVGDRVLVNKLAFRTGEVQRGDVVVFDGSGVYPGVSQEEDDATLVARVGGALGIGPGRDRDFVKRVVGVGGDRVICCDAQGRVTVNGTPLVEDYLYPGDAPSSTAFDVLVPQGRLWLMGDHRSNSQDSRSLLGSPGGGMVPVDNVVGRAFAVVWPFSHGNRLQRPATFADVADPDPSALGSR